MSSPFEKAFRPWAAFCGPGSFGFGRGGGFRWRIFDRGDLKYVILRLLEDRPMHGYEVMRSLEKESCGCYSASPGSVYPTLQLLEDEGFVHCEEEEGRKVYTITEEGREFLARNRDRVEDIFDRVADFAKQFSGAPMSNLTRSFVRLAQVSFEQAVRRPGDPDALGRLRDILERAAREAEAVGSSGTGKNR